MHISSLKKSLPFIRRAALATTDKDVQRLLVSALWLSSPHNLALAAALPGRDYPPSNLASMIKECETLGLSEAGRAIMDQWNRVLEKYPQTRTNWAAASVVGLNSVKKNVFDRQEFSVWLDGQMKAKGGKLDSGAKAKAKEIQKEIPAEVATAPKIAIPKPEEQPEDWQREAEKTKTLLDNIGTAFGSAKEALAFLEKEAASLKGKIAKYSTKTNKSGQESKYKERIPKWDAQLNMYEVKIAEMRKGLIAQEKKVKHASDAYNTAPVTTVAYEKEVQKSLETVLTVILNMDDIQKQRDALLKYNDMVEKLKVTAASEVTAGPFDNIVAMLSKFTTWFKGLLDKLSGAIDTFEGLATLRSI